MAEISAVDQKTPSLQKSHTTWLLYNAKKLQFLQNLH